MFINVQSLRCSMKGVLGRLGDFFDRHAPDKTPRRRMLYVISVVLLVEGLSVIALYSYFGVFLGLASVAIGLLILLSIYRIPEDLDTADAPFGIRLVEGLVRLAGGNYVVIAIGLGTIIIVIAYNQLLSARPEYGDLDTISILFGACLIAYPFLRDQYRVEITFSLLFISLVVVFLVLPQLAVALTSSGGESGVGSWYVNYMLAAPFSGILDLIGIPSSAVGNMVTIQFSDGTTHTLGISAYCAGLYSFSIFLSAFISFVLVFERLRNPLLAIVLSLGLVAAYAGNILRMVLIGVIGYYWGMDALLWAHKNVGWIIFLTWSSVFWYLIFRYISKREVPDEAAVT